MEVTIQKHLTKYMEEKESLNITLQTYYSETCLKQNLSSRELLQSQGSRLLVPVWNGICLQQEKISVPCGSVTGKFHNLQIP